MRGNLRLHAGGRTIRAVSLSVDLAIQQFLDHLRVERELSVATLAAYGHDLAALARFLVGRGVDDVCAVRPVDVLDYLAALTAQGISARSQARTLVAQRQFFKFLRGERICDTNPTEEIDLPHFGRKLPVFLEPGRGGSLLAAPGRSTPRGMRDSAMLETLYATGLRVSELVKLRQGDINLEAGYLVAFGKGKKQRIVPLGEAAVAILRSYIESARPEFLKSTSRPSEDAVFLTRFGRRMTRQGFGKSLAPTRARPASPRPSRRTSCAIPSPPTWSNAAPTCARCRPCWATRTSAPRKSTPTCRAPICAASTTSSTPRLGRQSTLHDA
jgi:integrase/recombinase XerD